MDQPHHDKPPKMPTENYNYHQNLVTDWRTDLKPWNVDQPEGPSFQVHIISTQNIAKTQAVLAPALAEQHVWVAINSSLLLTCTGMFWLVILRRLNYPCYTLAIGGCRLKP